MFTGNDKQLSERILNGWRKEHESLTDFLAELDDYVTQYPDDKWGLGQRAYVQHRLKELAEKIGVAVNRTP